MSNSVAKNPLTARKSSTQEELEDLAEDIAENGLRHPLVRYQGMILDGRNRLLACEMAGVDPMFIDHAGDKASALALVVSLTVQRRHLIAGQAAIVAARSLPMVEEAAKERMAEGGRTKGGEKFPSLLTREDAAKPFQVNDQAVQQAKALPKNVPDLAAQVESRLLNIGNAYPQYQKRRRHVSRDAVPSFPGPVVGFLPRLRHCRFLEMSTSVGRYLSRDS